MKQKLTYDRLREVLIYYPETGEWERLVRTGNRCTPGRFLGTVNRNDYPRIGVDGVAYLAHRLAWLYVTGVWPRKWIDHIDRDNTNNRFANLREATRRQNLWNQRLRRDNSTGYKGVYPTRNGTWRAQIRQHGRAVHLGCFSSPEEASEVFRREAVKLHGEFFADVGYVVIKELAGELV